MLKRHRNRELDLDRIVCIVNLSPNYTHYTDLQPFHQPGECMAKCIIVGLQLLNMYKYPIFESVYPYLHFKRFCIIHTPCTLLHGVSKKTVHSVFCKPFWLLKVYRVKWCTKWKLRSIHGFVLIYKRICETHDELLRAEVGGCKAEPVQIRLALLLLLCRYLSIPQR